MRPTEVSTPSPNIVQVEISGGRRTAFFAPERVRIGELPDLEVQLPQGVRAASCAGCAPGVALELRRTPGGYSLLSAAGEQLLSPGSQTEIVFGAQRCILRIGLTIPFGRHLLTGALSEGGMAQVFSARLIGPRDLVFGERAVKLIRPEVRVHAEIENMFLDEASIVSEIRHPNVVRIFDVGAEAGLLFIAMELVRGITLRRLLLHFQECRARVPPELAAALISQACRGLHAAHLARNAAGTPMEVIHRDVSPQNLICSVDGVVQVIDFGVARATGRLQRSAMGQFKGKPAYAAPEQVRGPTMDRRVDIFAAAVVLYELCTGHQPFSRENDYATLFAVVQEQAPELREVRRDIPKTLEALVRRAMAKDPSLRPQTAAEFADQLEVFLRQRGGRFLQPAEIAAFLTEQGCRLDDTAPVPLLAAPAVLVPPRPPPPETPRPAARAGPPPLPKSITAARKEEVTVASPPPPPLMAAGQTMRLPPLEPPAEPAPATPTVVVPAKAAAAPVLLDDQTLMVLPPGDTGWQPVRPGLMWRTVTLTSAAGRRPCVLPLCEVQALLPAVLQILVDPGPPPALLVDIALAEGARRGGDRPGLYLNAAEPATRQAGYLINSDVVDGHLDVGHRRLGVRRLGLCSRHEPHGELAWLKMPSARLGITFAAEARQLVAFYAPMDEAAMSSHVVCVRIT